MSELTIEQKLNALRTRATEIIQRASSSGTDAHSAACTEYNACIHEFLAAGGSSHDLIVKIGESVFGTVIRGGINDKAHQGPSEDLPIEGSVRLPFDYLEQFMFDSFRAAGVPEPEARICADVLIEADKRGIDSHGVGRLKPIYFDRIKKNILKPFVPVTVVKETPATALVDGHLGLGLYVGPYCMRMAIEKAKKCGVGFVVAQNSTHYGIAGYYASMATEANCVGLTGTNARPSIAPTFGVQPCLGTNPLTFGIPTDEEFPFVLDCATSINQRGKIEKYERLGLDTPRGMVIDNEGNERTDSPGVTLNII